MEDIIMVNGAMVWDVQIVVCGWILLVISWYKRRYCNVHFSRLLYAFLIAIQPWGLLRSREIYGAVVFGLQYSGNLAFIGICILYSSHNCRFHIPLWCSHLHQRQKAWLHSKYNPSYSNRLFSCIDMETTDRTTNDEQIINTTRKTICEDSING